jgi:hypothetical protein
MIEALRIYVTRMRGSLDPKTDTTP